MFICLCDGHYIFNHLTFKVGGLPFNYKQYYLCIFTTDTCCFSLIKFKPEIRCDSIV